MSVQVTEYVWGGKLLEVIETDEQPEQSDAASDEDHAELALADAHEAAGLDAAVGQPGEPSSAQSSEGDEPVDVEQDAGSDQVLPEGEQDNPESQPSTQKANPGRKRRRFVDDSVGVASPLSIKKQQVKSSTAPPAASKSPVGKTPVGKPSAPLGKAMRTDAPPKAPVSSRHIPKKPVEASPSDQPSQAQAIKDHLATKAGSKMKLLKPATNPTGPANLIGQPFGVDPVLDTATELFKEMAERIRLDDVRKASAKASANASGEIDGTLSHAWVALGCYRCVCHCRQRGGRGRRCG